MEKGEQNAAIEKKFSNARWKKPLDKNKKVCYNKYVIKGKDTPQTRKELIP